MRNALVLLALAFTASVYAKILPSPTPSTAPRPLIWTESARRFTGETESVRLKAIAKLKKYPNLKGELKKALGSADHFLALDVISVLRLRNMLGDLTTFSERDHTGYSYHVINSLLEKKDEEKIGDLYLERLDLPKTSPAAKIAIVDALARMNRALGDERAGRLLKDDSPEVRSATLSLIRTELVQKNIQKNLQLLDETISDPSFQIRIQTLYLVSELPASLRRANLIRINGLIERCAKDSVDQVRALCEAVRKGGVE